jgi:hypothetical protein
VYFLKLKSEAGKALSTLINDAATPEHLSIRRMRSDGGGEFEGEFRQVCRKAGIKQELSAPYSPQQNGVAERSWETIMGMARCLLNDAGLSKIYWAEAVKHAVYLLNRLPTSALNGNTPYQAWHGKHAQLDNLRVFGAKVWVQVEDRRKLDDKAWRGVMVGCEENKRCYRVLDTNTRQVYRSAHVTFDEGQATADVNTGSGSNGGGNQTAVRDPGPAEAEASPGDAQERAGVNPQTPLRLTAATEPPLPLRRGQRQVKAMCRDASCIEGPSIHGRGPRCPGIADNEALPAVSIGMEYALAAAEAVTLSEPLTL